MRLSTLNSVLLGIVSLFYFSGCVTLPSDVGVATGISVTATDLTLTCEEIRLHQYLISIKLTDVAEQQLEKRVEQSEAIVQWTAGTWVALVAVSVSGQRAVSGVYGIFALAGPTESIVAWASSHDTQIALLKAELEALETLARKYGCK